MAVCYLPRCGSPTPCLDPHPLRAACLRGDGHPTCRIMFSEAAQSCRSEIPPETRSCNYVDHLPPVTDIIRTALPSTTNISPIGFGLPRSPSLYPSQLAPLAEGESPPHPLLSLSCSPPAPVTGALWVIRSLAVISFVLQPAEDSGNPLPFTVKSRCCFERH